MSSAVSRLYAEEGELWLRVSPGHAISERWLRERTPELYARWWTAPSTTVRDELALQMEQRLEELEQSDTGRLTTAWLQQRMTQPTMRDRVARYEQDARRLAAIALDDSTRPATHLAYQAAGDALRAELAAAPTSAAKDVLGRRLDAADLVADRPVIQAAREMAVQVDLLPTAFDCSSSIPAEAARADAIPAEMAAEDPHAALRADVLSAVAAAGHDPAVLRSRIEQHGVDLTLVAPALMPVSDCYARHRMAIEAYLDREITAGGFEDLRAYMVSWRWGRAMTTSLHDAEQAIVEHIVGGVIVATDEAGDKVRQAHRMWERATDRVDMHCWSAALDRAEPELGTDRIDGQEQLRPQADDDVEIATGVEQEVR